MEVAPVTEPLEFSGSVPRGSTSVLSSTPDRSLSASSTRSSDSQAALKSEEYRQLFRLPADEVLLQDFNCALQENILLQGHLYVFTSYVCFYSNIFGFETKKIIHNREITGIKRSKTAGIFPTAIEIHCGEKRIYFVSFLSRDEALRLIEDGCSQKSLVSDMVTQTQASPPHNEPIETGYVTEEIINLPDDEKMDSCSRIEEAAVNPQESVVETSNASSVVVRTPTWHVLDADAPEIAKEYTKVAESTFPIKVDVFFERFFSDDAMKFIEDFHMKSNDKDFKCSSWLFHETTGHTRTIDFQHPIKIYFGAKFGSCREVQSFRVYKNSHLVIETSQYISDVPYSDYFSVKGLWHVRNEDKNSNEGCTLNVYLDVAFTKKTVFKGKITQSTFEECRESYALWIEMALEHLNRRKSLHPGQNSKSRASISTISMETVNGTPHSNIESASVASYARTVANNISRIGFPSLSASHLLVISFVVILLMQMSILVLLCRPAAVVSSVGIESKGGSPEYVEWMERRVRHLKDDIYDAENRVDRLRREHELLKSMLKRLR